MSPRAGRSKTRSGRCRTPLKTRKSRKRRRCAPSTTPKHSSTAHKRTCRTARSRRAVSGAKHGHRHRNQAARGGGASNSCSKTTPLPAPEDGIVLTLASKVGQRTSGEEIAHLAASGAGYKFRATLSEEQAEHVALGDEISLTFGGDSMPVKAKIVSLSQDNANETAEITAAPARSFLPAGRKGDDGRAQAKRKLHRLPAPSAPYGRTRADNTCSSCVKPAPCWARNSQPPA